jgi:hypothetical protein
MYNNRKIHIETYKMYKNTKIINNIIFKKIKYIININIKYIIIIYNK